MDFRVSKGCVPLKPDLDWPLALFSLLLLLPTVSDPPTSSLDTTAFQLVSHGLSLPPMNGQENFQNGF